MDQPWVYIVLFGLVFIVYAKIMPKSSAEKGQQSPSIHEIEQTMDHFASELEEQNRVLLQQLAGMKQDYELQASKLDARVEKLEAEQGTLQQEYMKLNVAYEELEQKSLRQTDLTSAPQFVNGTNLQNAIDTNEASLEEQQPEPSSVSMKGRYTELFALYEQGKSTESIAKKLNMTKGEVNLIIQLAKQEEKLHAQ
ncbi:DUF6115 domain-containing protein [Paenibacillus rigui]|uniref:Uncharacterized protein n=1 Tax=Paenibacillus rigui TaxID=554312 RepID=A0A229UMM9_9BACL|nr:hypothetical protein [Paenibacillus rigui]OXM84696.1 hypothetical protein CF651_19525 [Paenibacillus rigui]